MKIVGIVIGGLIALVALPFLVVGIGIVGWLGDGSGLSIPLNGLDAPKRVVAIVSPEFSVKAGDIPSQIDDASLTVRITPKPGTAPLFIGLGPTADVERYLRRTTTAHVELADTAGSGTTDTAGTSPTPNPTDIATGNGADVRLVVDPGPRKRVAPPATKGFWLRTAASSTGDITLSLRDLEGRNLRVVVMRTDGRPGMAVDATLKARVPLLRTVGWWVLGIGIAAGLLGVGLIIWMIVLLGRPKKLPPAAPAPSGTGPAEPQPQAPTESSAAAPAVDTTPLPQPPDDDAPSR